MMDPDQLADFLSARCGKLTASRMADAMARLKNGGEAEDRKKLKIELVAERMTGDSVPHYVNDAMRWGLATEDEAKAAFEAETGLLLTPCGTIDHPEIEWFAATPDALIGRDAVAEFKCPATTTHVGWVLAGVVPEQHKPQILAQLACTGRTRAIFCSYDPRVKRGPQLFIREWTPDQAEIAAIEAAAREFLAEVDAMFDLATAQPALEPHQ